MNVLLVAEESAGIQTLRLVTESEHEVAGVMTTPPTRGGGATVASAASALGIPVLPSERVREPAFADWVHAHDVDLLLNVHSLFVIDANVIRAPRLGAFNLHPGPLPEYAGLNAPSWAIYFGETRHAVTLHWMDAEIDTGAIAYSAGSTSKRTTPACRSALAACGKGCRSSPSCSRRRRRTRPRSQSVPRTSRVGGTSAVMLPTVGASPGRALRSASSLSSARAITSRSPLLGGAQPRGSTDEKSPS